jgi:hypothetical protein
LALPRGDPRLLHEIVGVVSIVREHRREALQPGDVLEQVFRTRHFGHDPILSPTWQTLPRISLEPIANRLERGRRVLDECAYAGVPAQIGVDDHHEITADAGRDAVEPYAACFLRMTQAGNAWHVPRTIGQHGTHGHRDETELRGATGTRELLHPVRRETGYAPGATQRAHRAEIVQ